MFVFPQPDQNPTPVNIINIYLQLFALHSARHVFDELGIIRRLYRFAIACVHAAILSVGEERFGSSGFRMQSPRRRTVSQTRD